MFNRKLPVVLFSISLLAITYFGFSGKNPTFTSPEANWRNFVQYPQGFKLGNQTPHVQKDRVPNASPRKPESVKTAEASTAEVLRQISTRSKVIALTFDDGPDPVFTRQALKMLKKHNAHATFFLLGHHIEKYPGIAAQITSNGNEAGVHSYDHKFLNRLSYSEAQNQVTRTYNLVYKATGRKPELFRPPFGFYNENVLKIAGEKEMKLVLWTTGADPKDYDNPGTGNIVKQLVKSAKPGMIVLLHDYGGNREQTIAAMDRVITTLKGKGYEFQTISQILAAESKEK